MGNKNHYAQLKLISVVNCAELITFFIISILIKNTFNIIFRYFQTAKDLLYTYVENPKWKYFK